MGKLVDLTGQRFGKLLVLRQDGHTSDGKIKWLCRCDCGNEKTISGASLKRGHSKSCGCGRVGAKIVLTGQRFGEWTAVSYVGRGMWNCVCSCGTTRTISVTALNNGTTKSCGCKIERNYIGEKYGLLTVLDIKYTKNHRKSLICQCECGNTTILNSTNWEKTKSCGCLEWKAHITHGLRYTRLNSIWNGIKDRCYNSNSISYPNYGGRGIIVCNEWKDNFKAFYDWAMKNGYDETAPYGKCTIDRIDNNGNYEPSNCRWVDKQVQANNTRTNRYVEFNGKTQSVAMWGKELGIPRTVITQRLNKCGWSVEKALTTPVKISNRNKKWHISNLVKTAKPMPKQTAE